MKKLINHWFDLNLVIAIAIIIFIIVDKTNFDFQQRLLLFEFAFYNGHLFEEYGHPGTMAGTLNVALCGNQKAPTIYPFNQLSAIVCNYLFGIIIWLVPILEPHWNWAVLAAVLWGFIEFSLHLLYYPHKTRGSLNGGILTAMFGFLPCGVIYLAFAFYEHLISWPSIIIALIYPIAWATLIFRELGLKMMATPNPKFPFTTKQLVKYVKSVKEHPIHHHAPYEF